MICGRIVFSRVLAIGDSSAIGRDVNEATGHEAEATTHEAEATTHEAEAEAATHEAEAEATTHEAEAEAATHEAETDSMTHETRTRKLEPINQLIKFNVRLIVWRRFRELNLT